MKIEGSMKFSIIELERMKILAGARTDKRREPTGEPVLKGLTDAEKE